MPAASEVVAWWGTGPPPTERWPGVTVPIDDAGGRFEFSAKAADKVCKFFPKFCSHSKGVDFAGKPFRLLDYQTHLILRPLFGWLYAAGPLKGLRRFQKAYIQIPKKNGKTQLIAGLAIYMLLCDDEPGAEVYVAAADQEQARILFAAAKAMVEANPSLAKRLVVLRNEIRRADDPTAFFKVLSSEAATKHGPNIHCLIIDELHAQPDRDLFETLTRGVLARRQPLIIEITTAGDDDESICFEEYDYAKRVLSGTINDERLLPVIFEATVKEDWLSPDVWARVNPGLGETFQIDKIETFAREAANEPRKRNDFLRYHLNRWTSQATAWIPLEWWDACDEPMPPDDVLATMLVALGIDMSQKIDLTSVVALFKLPLVGTAPPVVAETVSETETGEVVKTKRSLNYRIAILPAFWLPAQTIVERAKQDGVRYDLWRDDKLLFETEGAVIDSDAIVRYIKHPDKRTTPIDLATRFPLVKQAEIGYDPAFATEIGVQLRDECGFKDKTVEVLQNYKHLSEACQVFEALVKAKRVIHGGHQVLRWNLENVSVKTDEAGRIRPVKPKRRTKRIDGVVATLIALSRLMQMPESAPRQRGRARVWTPGGWVPANPAEHGSGDAAHR